MLSLVALISFWQLSYAFHYLDRMGQPHFDPEAHGLSKSESYNDISWNEVFADEVRDMMNREKMTEPFFMGDDDIFYGHFEVDHRWPYNKYSVGQIGGLATDNNGYLHIFHRADRVWALDSSNESIAHQNTDKIIKKSTVLIVNISDGNIINQWGENMFVLPHGIEIDRSGNVFVTDVALHQVLKFENGQQTPSLVLGEAFKPAKNMDDDDHFCMPTDVAVASNGDFFISDGYCISRIMKFNVNGNLLKKFGMDDSNIPHSVALAEDLDLLCVADREGMRILCYKAGIKEPNSAGEPKAQFNNEKFGRIYGITYSASDGLLYGILGKTGILKSQGFSIDMKDNDAYEKDVIAYWSPDDEGFSAPHAIAVSSGGGSIFVGEMNPNYVWKFNKYV